MEPVQHVQLTVRLAVQYAQEGAADIAHTPGIAVALARIRASGTKTPMPSTTD